jgi:hypothetical protein
VRFASRCVSNLSSFMSFPSLTSSNSFPVNPFADPHPLNPVVSYRYKNIGGRGASSTRFQSISFIFISLHTLLHFFALSKNSTLFFSIVSALFAKNRRGGGRRQIVQAKPSSFLASCSYLLVLSSSGLASIPHCAFL